MLFTGLAFGNPGPLRVCSFPPFSYVLAPKAPTTVSSQFFQMFYSEEMQRGCSQTLYHSIPETGDTHTSPSSLSRCAAFHEGHSLSHLSLCAEPALPFFIPLGIMLIHSLTANTPGSAVPSPGPKVHSLPSRLEEGCLRPQHTPLLEPLWKAGSSDSTQLKFSPSLGLSSLGTLRALGSKMAW